MKRVNIVAVLAVLLTLAAVALSRHVDFTAVSRLRASSVELIVSSSADAGPGTLRDAMVAADRVSAHARIVVHARKISVNSALPILTNPRGVTLESDADTVIDASQQTGNVLLQVNSPLSSIRGLHIANAREVGILVNAPGLQIEAVTISGAKVGISIAAAGKGCAVRSSFLEDNDTGITAEEAVRDVTIVETTFRRSGKAGFWFVGPPERGTALATVAAVPSTTEHGPGEVAAVKESVRLIQDVFEDNVTGVVLANRPTLIQRSRFLRSRQSAILVLGGAARIEDDDISESGGAAVSIMSGAPVLIARNSLTRNANTAIMARNGNVVIEHNIVQANGFGIVAISSVATQYAVIRDNIITKNTGDAVTLVGGSPWLRRNQVLDNRTAGLRVLDLVADRGGLKATPHLEDNVVKGNGVDVPATSVYKVAANLDMP